MVDLSLHHHRSPVAAPLAVAPFAAAVRLLDTWRRRARERDEMTKLDHRALRDLGLSASQVQFEANKPFWRD